MAQSYKSQALAQELQNALSKRFPVVSAVQFDVDGSPFVLVGTGVVATQSAIVKVSAEQALGTNALGQPAASFTPHVMQIVLETSTVANVALMVEASKLALFGECQKFGTKVELYMSPNTNAVDPTDIVVGNLKAVWNPNLKYGTTINS
jgi:hypothetical protein